MSSYGASYPQACDYGFPQPTAFEGKYSQPPFGHSYSYQSPVSNDGSFPQQSSSGFFPHPVDAYYSPAASFTAPPVVKEEQVLTSYQPPAQVKPSSPSTSSWKSPGPRTRIPPGTLCAICSDLANAYHYGVASCNGCKTFFRRTIVDGHAATLRCQFEGRCEVSKEVRNACRYCRFNKCLQAGMDSTAFQGRRDRRSSTVGSPGYVSSRPKVPEGALCLVCADFASGYHYGVASCHGCKAFFRRTVIAGHVFVCQRDGTCAVMKRDPTCCRACRLNKCFEAGMTVDAIQSSRDRRGPRKMRCVANASHSFAEVPMPAIHYEEPFPYATVY